MDYWGKGVKKGARGKGEWVEGEGWMGRGVKREGKRVKGENIAIFYHRFSILGEGK